MLLGDNIGPVVLYCRKPVEGWFNGGEWEGMCANDDGQYRALATMVTYQCVPFTYFPHTEPHAFLCRALP